MLISEFGMKEDDPKQEEVHGLGLALEYLAIWIAIFVKVRLNHPQYAVVLAWSKRKSSISSSYLQISICLSQSPSHTKTVLV
jgi:hypothetical protein